MKEIKPMKKYDDKRYSDEYLYWKEKTNMLEKEIQILKDNPDCMALLKTTKERAIELGIRSGLDNIENNMQKINKSLSEWTQEDKDWMIAQNRFLRRFLAKVKKAQDKGQHSYFDGKKKPRKTLITLMSWGHNPIENNPILLEVENVEKETKEVTNENN